MQQKNTLQKIFILLSITLIIYFLYSNKKFIESSKRRQGLRDISPYSMYNYWVMKNTKFPCTPIEKNTNIYFENGNILKENWKIIRDEIEKIIEKGHTKNITEDMFFRNFQDSSWTCFYLKTYSKDFFEEAKMLAPKTVSLLKNLPQIKFAMFSILGPKTKIKPHRGPFKGALRYHLGLECPENGECYINVDDKKYSWKNGEDVIFDDTYVHEVVNDTNERRIILFCDIIRPMKSNLSTKINQKTCDYFAPLFLKSNKNKEKQDKI